MINLSSLFPSSIKKFRIDVGMSSTATNSAHWLNKYNDLAVLGFEPNPFNYQRVLDGNFIVPNHIQVIANKKITRIGNDSNTITNYSNKGNYFFPIECAIDNVENITQKKFYCTNMLNTGCSSLHKPIDSRLHGVITEKEIMVNIISLKEILKTFPFDTIPFIEFLKTDTQANDLNVIKSCGEYLKKICFIFSEYYAHSAYEGEKNQNECFNEFHSYMVDNNFKLYYRTGTDVGYVNMNLINYIIDNRILNDSNELPNGYEFLNTLV